MGLLSRTGAPRRHPRNAVGDPWKARMRPLKAAIEGCAPGDEKRVHRSVLPTTLTSSNVSGVEPVPQRNEEITGPRQLGVATEVGGEKHALRPSGGGKGALLEDSLHLTPEEQQKWESLKEEFADADSLPRVSPSSYFRLGPAFPVGLVAAALSSVQHQERYVVSTSSSE